MSGAASDRSTAAETARRRHLFVVVGEESGDALAAPLIADLKARYGDRLTVSGLAGPRMAALGLSSLFPIHDVAVMGIDAVLARLPLILRRIKQTADAAIAAGPDALLIVDSPDFTHRVARRVRRAAPDIPIIGYVSPSVWAWRPGRAKAMRAYVDHLLAVLPFEPEVHQALGGPPCTYVGHRLIEDLHLLCPAASERTNLGGAGRAGNQPIKLLILPGSRQGEIDRHLPLLQQVIARLAESYPEVTYLLPTVPHLHERVEKMVGRWDVKPVLIEGEGNKYAAFRSAHAALAASGTVTLELALAQVPTVVFYKLDRIYRLGRKLNRFFKIIQITWISLPNIILKKTVLPELIEEEASVARLIEAVAPLLRSSAERESMLADLSQLREKMAVGAGATPSQKAAQIVASILAD